MTRQAILDDSTPPRVVTVNLWDHPVGLPCPDWVTLGTAYVDGAWVDLPPVPASITPRQARIALALQPGPDGHATLLHAVEAALAALPEPQRTVARITWEYATDIQRHDPLIEQLAASLGLTQAQIDGLFVQAAGL